MKNRLKGVFSHDEPSEYLLTMTFADQTAEKDFYEKLDLVYESGEPQAVTGIQCISMQQTILGHSYPHSKHSRVEKVAIYPSSEAVPINVETEYGEYRWEFERIHTKTGATIQNAKSSIVYIVIKIDQVSRKITLSYTINLKNASSMYEIACICSAAISLFKRFFKVDVAQIDGQFSGSIKQLKAMALYFKTITELEKKLDKSFNPANITEDETELKSVYELYFMLVKGAALRENRLITGFSVDYPSTAKADGLTPGKLLSMNYQSTEDYNIFGESFSIYVFSIAFNLILESISDDQENRKYNIKMTDSDSAPGYTSRKGFLEKAQLLQEERRMEASHSECIEEYKAAKNWSEWVRLESDL